MVLNYKIKQISMYNMVLKTPNNDKKNQFFGCLTVKCTWLFRPLFLYDENTALAIRQEIHPGCLKSSINKR